jgi:long-chain acyl-CoA synthetase
MTETSGAAAGKLWPAVSLAEAHAMLTRPGSTFEMETRTIGARTVRTWKNGPQSLRDIFLAGRAHGSKTFLVYEDERVSFEAFARASIAVAHELQARGVQKGDRVAIAMRNVTEWPVAVYGALLTGAIAVLVNAWWTGPELQYGLVDSGARVALLDAERLERLAPHLSHCPALEGVLVCHTGDGSLPPASRPVRRLEDVIGPPSSWERLAALPMPDVAIAPEDDATILYTSGTTGGPKGALATHRNGSCYVLGGMLGAARNFLRRGEPVPAPDPNAPQKSVLIGIPLFHTTGFHVILLPALASGAKVVMMRRFDAERALELLARERCTATTGVPAIAMQLVEHAARDKYDLSALEAVAYGGAPAASDLARRVKEAWPKAAPSLGWGMTETCGGVASHSAEDYLNRPDSSGPALPICDLRIVDDDGRALPPGEVGELLAYGPNIAKCYWGKPEATAATFIDGWMKTGDLAWLDEEGFLYIVDRKKDMLIRGGENIYCIEVEDALYRHPAVLDAAVVGIPHRLLGEEPGAVVQLKPGTQASEAELRAFVAGHLAAFKVPVAIKFMSGELPRNANGKIMKAELRKLFA